MWFVQMWDQHLGNQLFLMLPAFLFTEFNTTRMIFLCILPTLCLCSQIISSFSSSSPSFLMLHAIKRGNLSLQLSLLLDVNAMSKISAKSQEKH